MIETILDKNDLLDKFEKIYTNPGQWETVRIDESNENDSKDNNNNDNGSYELIKCQRYELNPPQDCRHYKLSLCSANMCKSKIINTIIKKYGNNGNYKIIYIGDGGGDYCACASLRNNIDIAMVRRGKTLEKVIDMVGNNDEKFKDAKTIDANIKYWNDGKGLLDNFKEAIPAAFASVDD